MEKHGKFWGTTSPLFHKNNVEIHRIEGRRGGYSSEHCHQAKYNMFFVEAGKLKIVTWKDPSNKPDVTLLGAGESCTISPGHYHKFEVIEDCIAYEIYWVELNSNDIQRRNSGGYKKSSALDDSERSCSCQGCNH